jgi:hypothetical protein
MMTGSHCRRLLVPLLTLVLFGSQQGCRAFSFDRDWKRSALTPATSPSPAGGTDLTGKWEGSWHSEGTGHSGRLRAIMEQPLQSTAAPGGYDVRFDAIWGGIFRFGETIRLTTHPAPPTATQPATLTFDDTHNLGWLAGGAYQFAGEATADHFTCRYKCSTDHGTFEMKRLKVSGQ